ncbi:serine O-acetyltransferase [Novosphingobium malaysiense]|uniref:Hexapeptide transferase n=1 Tax=Novosphingobium malaysiense TaxID=1348853 RepID=A0A0B1ZWM9_9SPHN|nr:DapH/DapD/GlmU-related protein [Novosphingobium malaysiense]KHK93583.1 hexapeptide transferase [Novosphingobium malaysiense]
MAPIKPEQLGKPHRRGCPRSFRHLRLLLQADLYRYSGRIDAKTFWRHFLFTPGYKYTVYMRSCGYLKTKRFQAFGFYLLLKWLLLRCRYKFGIAIPEYTEIGPGLFINRFGGIYINGDTVIGTNANLTHGTMLGQANRGSRAGSPVLGDRVFIGAGAKIIGHIHLGEGCIVGANAVVTKDVPENAVVGGNPAKLISEAGSGGYINRLVPEDLLQRCRVAGRNPAAGASKDL